MDKQVICPNCRASIDIHNAKCPYCGYINEAGAEEEYMKELGDIKDKLDELDDEAYNDFSGELKSQIGRVIKIFLVLIIGLAAIFLLHYIMTNRLYKYTESRTNESELNEIVWQKDFFKRLDELYENEEFDALVELYTSDETEGHQMYNWSHDSFYSAYVMYRTITEVYIPDLDESEDISYTAGSMIYDSFYYYYRVYESDYAAKRSLSERDIELLEEYREVAVSFIYDRLKFTDEQMNDFKESGKVLKNGYLSHSDCRKLAEKYSKQFS